MIIDRDDALAALIPHVNERDIVVAVYQSCFDWLQLNPRDLNYVAVGAMGQASSHGLGLALERERGRSNSTKQLHNLGWIERTRSELQFALFHNLTKVCPEQW